MIIHIEICDVCGRVQRGIPVTGYCTAGSEVTWDVGACCSDAPFRVVDNKERRAQLRARIEALIVTEMQLVRDNA